MVFIIGWLLIYSSIYRKFENYGSLLIRYIEKSIPLVSYYVVFIGNVRHQRNADWGGNVKRTVQEVAKTDSIQCTL